MQTFDRHGDPLHNTQVLLSARKIFFLRAYGPHRTGLHCTIGGKNATTGVPTIAAICMGPVEFDTKTFARRINAPSSIRENFPATARGDPVIPVTTSSTNPSSPVPPVTITLTPSRRWTSLPSLEKFSALQSRDEPPLPDGE